MKRLVPLLLLVAPVSVFAQVDYVRANYTKQEVMIPMRDGVKLFTSIYTPKDTSKKAPILICRTPYSCAPYGADAYRASMGPESEFTKEGYIFVYQDVRGRYMSEGDFKWMTPYIPNKRAGQVDEATDSWDTVEWLLKNVPNNNGKVGAFGTSFPGHYAIQMVIEPHPALAAVAPQAPMADNWIGDDMHHNGAFFLPHAMNFIAGFGKKREGPTQNYGRRVFEHGTPDGYRFFLEMGPLKNALTKYNMNQIEIWKEWMRNGDYNEYWQAQNVPQHLKKADKVPLLIVGGWWDAEDLYGPLAIYKAIEKFTPTNKSKLVMGPWYHGSWNGGPGTSLHDIAWNTKTGEDYRNNMQRPFFRHHLWGDVADPNLPEVALFDVGADKWRTFSEWPARTQQTHLQLQPKSKLLMVPFASNGAETFDEWISDPAKPVPSSAAVSPGMPRQYLIEDQRFVWSRPDVMSYETAPLTEDVTLAGPIKATLKFTTTGTDADLVVKLIDVLPNNYAVASPRGADVQMGGYQMLVRGEPMRAKYRKSWSRPQPLRAGTAETVEFELPDICHTFKKGHKIMVQVQSSWFPVIDRNPQKFVNIYEANEEDFQKARHRLHVGGVNGSRLTLGRM